MKLSLKKLARKAFKHRKLLIAVAGIIAPSAVEKVSAKVAKLKKPKV